MLEKNQSSVEKISLYDLAGEFLSRTSLDGNEAEITQADVKSGNLITYYTDDGYNFVIKSIENIGIEKCIEKLDEKSSKIANWLGNKKD